MTDPPASYDSIKNVAFLAVVCVTAPFNNCHPLLLFISGLELLFRPSDRPSSVYPDGHLRPCPDVGGRAAAAASSTLSDRSLRKSATDRRQRRSAFHSASPPLPHWKMAMVPIFHLPIADSIPSCSLSYPRAPPPPPPRARQFVVSPLFNFLT